MADAAANAKQIFLGALDCASPEEVAAFLDNACGDDAAMRSRVDRLIAARQNAGAFLGGALMESVDAPATGGIAARSRVGPYQLLQQIGEGGFGVVFLADQECPVRRRVALKILKPGMDSRQVLARFEAERQALAMMDHPNIARVYDAGTSDAGQPYFVMELVQGVPITEYCDQCQLTTIERLELFVVVCRAVQHAHQKGIIHRDLKPSNVLLAIPDGRPTPKIIDFGVAKAINQPLTEHTLLTAFAQFLGTPLYMSPEQAELSPLGVDTRTDIYSLGVLLYELLTGTTPFDKDRLHVASYDELRRIIREEEPPRPSVRISTLAVDRATTLAAQHRTDPRRLAHAVSGELDWIVMKCLEKDRNRRYETAIGLARDVERYLADEPVMACPPSAGYRFRKFARRNKTALIAGCAAAAVFLTLLTGLAVSNRMIAAERAQAEVQRRLAQEKAEEERQARQLAQAEAAKSNAVVALVQDMLAAAHPDSASGKDYSVRELLDQFSGGLSQRLRDQPEVEATLRQIIGSVYTRLQLVDQAEPHLRRALELHRQLFGERHVKFADSQRLIAWNLLERNRADAKVEKLARQVLAVYEKQGYADRVLQAQWLLVLSLDGQGKTTEAELVANEALQFARKQHLESHPEVPNLMHHLAWIKIRQGDYRTAEQIARESVKIHEQVQGDAHPETAFGWTYLGAALHRQDKFAEAEVCYRKALEIFRRTLPEGHSYIRPTLIDLRLALQAQGRLAAEIELLRDIVRRRPDDALALNDLAWALCTCSETPLRDCGEALDVATKAVALEPHNGFIVNTLGVAHYRAGNFSDAIDALQKSVQLRGGGDAYDWFFLAMAEWRTGNQSAARDWYRKSDEWMQKHDPTNEVLGSFRAEAAELISAPDESATTAVQDLSSSNQ